MQRSYKIFLFLCVLYQLSYLPVLLISITRSFPIFEHFETFDTSILRILYLSLILITASYFCVWKYAQATKLIVSFKTAFLIILPLLLTLLVQQPLFSRDLYVYALNGKNSCKYNVNPYRYGWDQVSQKNNEWANLLQGGWSYKGISPYGPVFNIFASVISCFSENIYVVIFIFKVFVLIGFILTGYFLDKFLRNSRLDVNISVLYFLNPALLINFVLDGHNNVFGVLLMVLVLGIRDFSRIRSWILYVLAILIRYTYALFLPFLLVKAKKIDIKNLLTAFIILIVGFFLTYLPFGLPFLQVIKSLAEISKMHCLYSCSFIRNSLGAMLHFNDLAFSITFIIIYIIIFLFYAKGKLSLLESMFYAYMAFLFIPIKWFASWYLMLPLVFLIMLSHEKKSYLYLVFIVTLYSIVFRYFNFGI